MCVRLKGRGCDGGGSSPVKWDIVGGLARRRSAAAWKPVMGTGLGYILEVRQSNVTAAQKNLLI